MRPLHPSILALILWVVAPPLSAAPRRPIASLELEAPAGARGCLSADALKRSVEARLRRRTFGTPSEAELDLHVVFTRTATGWSVEVTLADRGGSLGHRELSTDAAHCSALDDSLALVVALLVDTPPERPPTPERTPPAEPNAPERAPTPIQLPPDTLAPREPWHARIGGAARLSLGLEPGAAPGVEVHLGLEPPRGPELRLSAEASLAERASLGQGDAGARVAAQRVGLDVCGLALGRTPRLQFCVGQRAGRLTAAGFGFPDNRSTSRLFASLLAGAEARLRLEPWLSAFFGVSAELPLVRTRLTARDASGSEVELFRVSPLVGSLALGLEVGPW